MGQTEMRTVVEVSDLSNEQFLEKYAAPGLVGLAGGTAFADRAIRRVQKRLTGQGVGSLWSHAFLCSGRRVDGHHWVLESDLSLNHKQIRLGVQENRASKYFDADVFPNLAILDFGLSDDSIRAVLTEALELLSGLSKYSLRELLGTLLAIHRPTLRGRENLLAREGSLYCSAMVQHCYARAGVEFISGILPKNTTPEDISQTLVPHTAYLLVRQRPRDKATRSFTDQPASKSG
jgi:hypothetical protein